MRRWLCVLGVVVLASVSIAAQKAVTFFSNGGHLAATFDTNTDGSISAQAWFQGDHGVLTISGPASCTSRASSKRYPSVGCYIADAPVGHYLLTVSSKSGELSQIYVTVSGELVVIP